MNANLWEPARAGSLLIPALSVGNFAIGMGAFVVIGVLTPIAGDLGLSKVQAGMVMTAYAIGYAILSPLLVALTGGAARRTILITGMSLFAVAMLASATAPDGPLLYAARVAAAAGAGMFTPVAAGVAISTSPPEQRGRTLAAVFFGLTLAQAIGVPVGSYVGYTFGWRATFVLAFAISTASLLAVMRSVPANVRFQVNTLRTLAGALGDWRSLLSVLFTATFLGSIYIVYTFVAPLLEEEMGFGRNGVTLVLLIFGVGAVAGNLVGGRLNDSIGPAKTLGLITAAQIVLMPAYSFLPLPSVAVALLTFIWSVCGWSFMVPQQARLVAQTPERQQVVLALNAAAIYIGASIGSAGGAWVFERWGAGALGIAGGLAAACVLGHLVLSELLAPKRVPART
jgi:predicted MFS family arabinose efflux permease